MASFTKDKGKVRAQIFVRGKRESKTFETKSEAKAWATTRENELQTGNGNAKITFLQLANLWVDRYPLRKKIDWEHQRLKTLLKGWLGELMLDELSPSKIAAWRDERLTINKSSTVLRDWNLLSAVCSMASKEMNLLVANPFSNIKRPEQPPPRNRLATIEELERLELVASARPSGQIVYRMFLLGIQTGMSVGECCRLNWSQIDYTKRVASLPPFKSRPARQVPLSKKAIELLSEEKDGSIFQMSEARADANWRNLCKAAAVDDLNFHDSRHMAATWLSKRLDALALAKMLGHRDLKMLLNVYYSENAAEQVHKLD